MKNFLSTLLTGCLLALSPLVGKAETKAETFEQRMARLETEAEAGMSFAPLAVTRAAQFLQGDGVVASKGDDFQKRFEAFVKNEQIDGEKFLAAFEQAVATGRVIAKGGLSPANKNFVIQLADRMTPELYASRLGNSDLAHVTTPTDSRKGDAQKLPEKGAKETADKPAGGNSVPTEIAKLPRDFRSFVHGGVRSLRAYDLVTSGDNFELTAKSDKTTAYAEFVFWDVLANDPNRIETLRGLFKQPVKEKLAKLLPLDGNFWELETWDFQARFGYTFNKDNNSSAAIVGAGEFNAEVTASKLFYVAANPGASRAMTIGLDLSYGLVTETSSLDAHHRFFAGPSFTVGIPTSLSSRGDGIFHLRGGIAGIDTVSFIDGTGNLIASHRGRPAYDLKRFWALEAELVHPIGQDLLVFGARVYSAGKSRGIPSTWSLSIGYSKPLESFIDFGLPKIPAKPEEKDSASAKK